MLEINLKKCLFWLEVVGLNNANLFEQLHEKKKFGIEKICPWTSDWAEHFENCSYRQQSIIKNLNLSDQMTRLKIFTIHKWEFFLLVYFHLVDGCCVFILRFLFKHSTRQGSTRSQGTILYTYCMHIFGAPSCPSE